MFGYVRPVPAELLVKDNDFYRATYCGICRAMKAHTGALSNVTLSYDSVALALVRMLFIDDSEISADMKRCIAHPLKKRCMINENAAIEYTARAFAVLTYYKALDDLADEGVGKRILTAPLRPILSAANRRAEIPDVSDVIRDKLAEITRLEKEGCASVDIPAGLFGELLGEIFSHGLEGSDALVTREFGASLGRFIYAADAAEDYERDVREGKYNPYAIIYQSAPLTAENKASIKCALILECRRMETAVNLMPFGNRATIENIVRNIIYLGLPRRISFLDKGEDTESESQNDKN